MWALMFLCRQGKPLEDAPQALITSPTDLDNRLSRLVTRILSCKNRPTELSPAAMAQQLEEAQVRLRITACMTDKKVIYGSCLTCSYCWR